MLRLRVKSSRGKSCLILSIDAGTTYSAVSYCIVVQDMDEDFQEVNRWPKQVIPDAKIPSVLYYDNEQIARLCGAETEDEDCLIEAEENKWTKAEWWKLCLRPDHLTMPINYQPSPLPPGITVDDIFRDHFAYIKKHVRDFIVKSYGNGAFYWDTLSPSMEVILTTPNGWEGINQNRMREAAIKAGLVDASGRSRVKFVSEGEAAIHYAFDSRKFSDWLKLGNNVLICDVGGGTTDVAIYRINATDPIQLEEIHSPRCFVAGGIFVNVLAREYIEGCLKGTCWDNRESIDSALRHFELHAKKSFDNVDATYSIKLDGNQSDVQRRIARGRLQVPRSDMVSFFRPCVKIIVDGLEKTLEESGRILNKVIVVGGFANSPYVFSEIVTWGRRHGISVHKPDGLLSKAIAHGALSWHMHSCVQAKIAKLHYGAEVNVDYDPNDPEMVGRETYVNIKGEKRVRHAWNEIVCKNTRIKAGQLYDAWFHRQFSDEDDMEAEMELYAYRLISPPTFIRDKDGKLANGFVHLCNVKADLRKCYKEAKYRISPSGKKYKNLDYQICLYFDEIEIRAIMRWEERGKERIGDATVGYDI